MAETAGTGSAAAVKASVSAAVRDDVREAPTESDGSVVVTENCTVTPACASDRRPVAAAVTLVIATAEVGTLRVAATPETNAL